MQARKADAVIAGAVASRERCVIGPVVLCELVWVLRDAYDTPKDQVVETLERILSTHQFEILDKDNVRDAFEAYRTGRGDFADYYIGPANRSAGCDETLTFDRRLRGGSRVSSAVRLSPPLRPGAVEQSRDRCWIGRFHRSSVPPCFGVP